MNDASDLSRRRAAPFPLVLLLGLGLGGALFFVTGFGAGVLVGNIGFLPGTSNRPPPGLGHTFDPYWEAWHDVDRYYVDRPSVQPKRMVQGSIEGMLASLGDVGHTTYLTAEELDQLEKGLKGELEGIGARMTVRKHQPTVVQTLPNSPARAAGLKPGDVLLEVDGKLVATLSLQQIVEKVRGPAGAVVHLKVLREGQPRPLEFAIARAKVEVPEISWHLLPGQPGIVHLAIQDFGEQADRQLRKAIEEVRGQEARGLIVDLRGNPGGLKEQAVQVTSEFLKDGNVFIEQDAQGNQTPVPVKPGGVATDIPLVVLIDDGTASSAEILAGALQDHHRGKLVGAKTFGTGTVLQRFRLSDGSAVLLAVAEWLTPDGRKIWHQGIAPDVAVTLPTGATILMPELEGDLTAEGLAKTEDQQLLKALEVLKADLH